VLDGGISHWQELDYPTSTGTETRTARTFEPDLQPDLLVMVDEVVSTPHMLLVDSRSPERYRGEEEPFDPVAGHIPGAVNAFYQLTLNENNTFQDIAKLQDHYINLLGNTQQKPTFYCGSGVTALVNVLAYKHSGLGDAKVYAGSWSEWITDPNRPVALGNEEKP
jgi:thiosulfate/3-mercaptopyruvate sulfurtransferase